MEAITQRLAVVVATRNRSADLVKSLDRLQGIPDRPQVVVVDNASSDGTAELVRRHCPEVQVLPLGENLGGAARTVGARHAATPYIAFSDDDSWWAPGSLARAVALLDAHPRLALLAARVLVGPDAWIDPTCLDMAKSPLPPAPDLPGPPVLGFIACGAVVRRTAYLAVGGFRRHFGIGGEEGLLAMDLAAAGWGLAYVEGVVAHHHPSPARDRNGRRRVLLRNGLWSAWLRRPLARAARETARLTGLALRDRTARAALWEALKGLPWVVPQRRCVPHEVEQSLRLLGH